LYLACYKYGHFYLFYNWGYFWVSFTTKSAAKSSFSQQWHLDCYKYGSSYNWGMFFGLLSSEDLKNEACAVL